MTHSFGLSFRHLVNGISRFLVLGLVIFGVSSFFPQQTQAAVTFDDNSTASGTGASFYNVNHTLSANADIAVAIVSYRDYDDVTSIVMDGDNFTFGCRDRNLDYTTELWYLTGPSTGSQTATVTFADIANEAIVNLASFEGVDQTSPFSDLDCVNFASTTNPTITLTTNTDDVVYGGFTAYSGFVFSFPSPVAGITELWALGIANLYAAGGYTTATGASTTLDWSYTGTNGPNSFAAIALQEAGAGGGLSQPPIFDSNTVTTQASGTSINASHTLGAATNFAVAMIHYRDTDNNQVSNVVMDGDNFTFGCREKGQDYFTEIWYVENPSTGSQTAAVSFDGGVFETAVDISSFENIDAIDPFSQIECATSGDAFGGWDQNPRITIPNTSSGELAYGGFSAYAGAFGELPSPNTEQTENYNASLGNLWYAGGYQDSTDTSTYMEWTWTAGGVTPWAYSSISLRGQTIEPTVVAQNSDSESSTDFSNFGIAVNSETELMVALVSYETSSSVEVEQAAIGEQDFNFGCKADDDDQHFEVWYLADPNRYLFANGMNVDMTGEVDELHIEVLEINNVDNSNPVAAVSCDDSNGSFDQNPTLDLSTADGQVVFGGFVANSNDVSSATEGSNTTELTEITYNSLFVATGHENGVDGTTTFDWTTSGSNSNWAIGALAVRPEAGGNYVVFENFEFDSDTSAEELGINDLEVSTDTELAVVVVAYRDGDETVSSVDFGGTNFTLQCRAIGGDPGENDDSERTEIWTLANPPTGTQDFNVNFTETVTFPHAAVLTYSNVDDVLPVRASSCTGTDGVTPIPTTLSTTVASEEGDYILGGYRYPDENDFQIRMGSDTYKIWAEEFDGIAGGAFTTAGSGTNTTIEFDAYLGSGFSDWSVAAISIVPEGAGPAPDTTPPSATFSVQPSDPALGSITFTGTATDADSNVASVSIDFSAQSGTPDTGTVSIPATDGTYDSQSEGFTFTKSDFLNNNTDYDFTITVTDVPGNTQTYDFDDITFFNSDPITLSITTNPDNPATGTLTIAGNAQTQFGVTTITGVSAATDLDAGTVSATADDGTFDSSDEDFSITIPVSTADIQGGSYSITVTATNTLAETDDQVFNGSFVAADIPDFFLPNQPSGRIDATTVSYTGSATGSAYPISDVSYNIFYEGAFLEPSFVSTTPTDGAFDELNEDFSFTTVPMSDGENLVFIKVTNAAGVSYNSFVLGSEGALADRLVIDAVDSSAPLIEFQPILPAPTFDETPYISGKVGDDTTEKSSNIDSMFYRIDAGSWVSVPAYDGAFDEQIEEFRVELPSLSVGPHTVDFRAIDAAGNDTDIEGTNATENFSIKAIQEPDNSVRVSKESEFDTFIDYDSIGSTNVVWGRDQLRLKEVVTLDSKTELSSGENKYGDRYDSLIPSRTELGEDACGDGFWISQTENQFAYYDRTTATEYPFDLTLAGVSGDFTQDIVSYQLSTGECHVWVGTEFEKLVGFDFGTDVTDGPESFVVYNTSSFNDSPFGGQNVGVLAIDPRDGDDYGLYYRIHGADASFRYLKPGNLASTGDDQSITYSSTSDFESLNSQAYILDTQFVPNDLWIVDYASGIIRINDNGTPLNQADDQAYQYSAVSFENGFDGGLDRTGNFFWAGDNGLQIISNYNGTPYDGSDDTVQTLIEPLLGFGSVYGKVAYNEGDNIIGEQYYVNDRAGQVIYYSTNNTLDTDLDDVSYVINVVGDQYPINSAGLIQRDDDSFTMIFPRQGVYDLDFDVSFAPSGTGLSKIYATLEGDYLDLDNIRLDDVDFNVVKGGTSYRVSNDAGFSFVPISLGETINFTNPGFELAFAIDLTSGSTPVIDSYDLSYSAYPEEGERTQRLSVDAPDRVRRNDSFSFTINLTDDTGFPLTSDETVTIELRSVDDDEVFESFNISSAEVLANSGSVTISGAKADTLGDYYINATSSEAAGRSGTITFHDDAEEGDPTLNFSASSYTIRPGETPTLYWDSTNLDTLELSSDNDALSLGGVGTDGSRDVTLFQTTTFKLKGSGDNGSLESTLTITVSGEPITSPSVGGPGDIIDSEELEEVAESTSPEPGGPPTIISFTATIVNENPRTIELAWEVENTINVIIPGVGSNLPLIGSRQVITDETEFSIEARNEFGSAQDTASVVPAEPAGLFENLPSFLPNFNLLSPFASPRPEGVLGTAVSLTPLLASTLLPLAMFSALMMSFGAAASGKVALRTLQALGILSRRNPQGLVFDTQSSDPIPFSLLTVTSPSTKEGETPIQETVVTDNVGVYQGITLPKGSYSMSAAHPDYFFPAPAPVFPSLTIREYYRGETFSVDSEKQEQYFLVPMKPRQVTKSKKNLASSIKLFVARLNFINFVVPLAIYSLVVTILYPVWFNLLVMAVYGILFALAVAKWLRVPRITGRVFDENGQPLKNAIVRLSSTDGQSFVSIVVSDAHGRYRVFAKPNRYQINVFKTGYAWQRDGSPLAFEEIDVRAKSKQLNIKMSKLEPMSFEMTPASSTQAATLS